MSHELQLPSVLILYASRGGQTAHVAQRIYEVMTEAEYAVDLVSVSSFDWQELSHYSILLWGSPTYGSGDLHPDWDQAERLLRSWDLSAYRGAAFGCGSARYPSSFWAVDILHNRLKNGGAQILQPGLKMETMNGLRVRDADSWVNRLIQKI